MEVMLLSEQLIPDPHTCLTLSSPNYLLLVFANGVEKLVKYDIPYFLK